MAASTLGLDSPPRRPSSAARFASRLGTASLVLPLIGLATSAIGYKWCERSILFFLLTPLTGIGAILAGLVAGFHLRRHPELSDEGDVRRAYLKGFASIPLLFLSIVLSPVGSLPPCGERINGSESSAVGSLRTINTACATYASTYPERGFPRALEHLGPPQSGKPEDAENAGLIDQVLAGGRKSGYVFDYRPGPPDSKGIVTTYSVTARPQDFGGTGARSFYTDQTGIFLATTENRAATAQDPPLN